MNIKSLLILSTAISFLDFTHINKYNNLYTIEAFNRIRLNHIPHTKFE